MQAVMFLAFQQLHFGATVLQTLNQTSRQGILWKGLWQEIQLQQNTLIVLKGWCTSCLGHTLSDWNWWSFRILFSKNLSSWCKQNETSTTLLYRCKSITWIGLMSVFIWRCYFVQFSDVHIPAKCKASHTLLFGFPLSHPATLLKLMGTFRGYICGLCKVIMLQEQQQQLAVHCTYSCGHKGTMIVVGFTAKFPIL
jgi:hypothetical protein